MQCHVCESTEFILHDGGYFCRECNSQIEASRKEQAEQEAGFSKKSLLKSTSKEKNSKASKKKKLYYPWTTTDGYNLILYKQVSALINIGASEKLKNVVLYIWSKYLQTCEVAFRVDYNSKENVPRLSAFARKRDVKLLYGDKDASRPRLKKKPPKENLSKIELEVDEKTDISDELGDDSSDGFETKTSDLDSESSGTSDHSSTHKGNNKFNLSSHARKLQKTFGKKKVKKPGNSTKENCVHHMTLSKTLSFCYLGLLFTEDRMSLCDLLRLVKEGKIPYIEVLNCFPPSMKIQGEDHSIFTTFTVPDVVRISQMSAKLFEFLKLPSFKHRAPMPIVFRYVKDLNLPDSIIPIVNHLHNKMERKNAIWFKITKKSEKIYRIPLYEAQAMALIIVALKLLMVLDGKFELEHSKVMMKINSILKGRKLFVWEEWRRQMYLKEYLFIKNGYRYSDYSRLDSLSAEEIIRKYPITRLREFGNYSNRMKSTQTIASVGRKEIKTILENVTNHDDAPAFNKTSSFPLKYELSRFTTEGATWQMFKETQKIDFTFLNKDFSSDLIFYKRTGEMSQESEELIYILLSSLYESTEILTLNHISSNILKTSSKYWYKGIHRFDFVEKRQLWCEKLPASFVWLLKLLSRYMQVSCEELYTEVVVIEKELILHVQNIRPHMNNSTSNLPIS